MEKQDTFFTERARKNDPESSKIRAAELTGTLKLSTQAFIVLNVIAKNPGETAFCLGMRLFHDSGDVLMADWPHKHIKKLVNKGFVRRVADDDGFKCWATTDGLNALTHYREINS